ncbi:hypothetical protein KFL_000540410 [Klebsormidium nitens]|uniref:Small ribosomal subunit protein mS29 n=1 Tax=Klebsormidium nitens TaxID=105231 RepID=A0A0U9HIA2_KLENI|nr:hypothetical protein KFL_000540410 [Klebsormidium nitens]|eukprot:GAQ80466.1 hypothetical protein KFL_000540410 [Klebsormidium nitens]
MALPSSAQYLVSLARGSSSSQLKERALSALCASTSGSSVSGPNRRHDETRVHCLDDTEQAVPIGASISSKVAEGSAIRAWLARKHILAPANRLARCKNFQSLHLELGSVAQSIGIQTCLPDKTIGSKSFATAAAKGDSDPTFEDFLSGYKSKKDDDGEEEALRQSMAAIKQNLSVSEGAELGPEAVNRFYTLSEEDMRTRLAEGLPRSLEKEFAQQKEKRILVRRQGLDLFEKVKQRVEDRKSYQYRALVLKGPKGSGKSSLLALLVHQCRSAGWLALYVPSGTSWISGWFYGKDEKSGFFDTPVQAEKALKALLAAHGDLLESLPIRVPLSAIGPVFGGTASVDLDTEELATGTPEEGSLKSLVEKGLENEGERAGEMLARLRVELTRVTEVPVLIAIDEYNSWFGTSAYGDVNEENTKTRRIDAGEMRLVHAFGHLDGDLGLKNGVVVAAASGSLGLPADVRDMPGVYKDVRKMVHRFDREETGAILTNYFACGVMINASKRPKDETITTAHFLTGGNGHELRYYGPLFQADRPALPTPEAFQPLLAEGGYTGDDRQPAPRIRNFVQSLSGEF